jgi:hypothetical protein
MLVLITALLVARPLVIGEDPGLQTGLAGPGGLVLTLLWLVAAAGWAAWRLRSKAPWRGGVAEAALLTAAVLVFVAAEVAARYKHPARLIAWEWLALAAGFVLVRHLCVRPNEQRLVFCALLASGVALSAQAAWQAAVEVPAKRAKMHKDPDKWRREVAAKGLSPEGISKWVEEGRVFGTYGHPNSFAGLLVLLIPGLVAAPVLAYRTKAHPAVVVIAGASALLTLIALALTRSRGAFLGLAVVGVGAAAVRWRHELRRNWLLAAGGAVALALLAWGAIVVSNALFGKGADTARYRLDYWKTTAAIIGAHPWLGVGPGNFGNAYTKHMPPEALETVKDPHNFVLEIWATAGPLAMLAVVAALAAVFVRVARAPTPADDEDKSPTGMAPVRWELYLAGVLGLLLGFLLEDRVEPDPSLSTADQVLVMAFQPMLRSVVWFVALAALERIAWPRRTVALALLAGLAALLVNLLVSGGIGFPSVAGPLWAAAALALACTDGPAPEAGPRQRLATVALFPALAAALWLYGFYVFAPVSAAGGLRREAQARAAFFFEDQSPKRPAKERVLWRGRAGEEHLRDPLLYLRMRVVAPLEKAAQTDDKDARLLVDLAGWQGEFWQRSLDEAELLRSVRAVVPAETHSRNAGDAAFKAVENAVLAQKLDPEGAQGYRMEHGLRKRFAERLENRPPPSGGLALGVAWPAWVRLHRQMLPVAATQLDQAREQYALAALALLKYSPNDPNNPSLHMDIAEALMRSGDVEAARAEAVRALELDDQAPPGPRKLTDRQRGLALVIRGDEPAD